jgi:hypothetical protein
VDGGKWFWWGGSSWGENGNPRKRRRRSTPRRNGNNNGKKIIPKKQKLKIRIRPKRAIAAPEPERSRSGTATSHEIVQGRTRRAENKKEWMDFVPDMHMRILLAINSDQTAWLAKTPAVDAWGEQEHTADLRKVPGEEDYQGILVRIHYRWRENDAFNLDHATLRTELERLYKSTNSLYVEQPGRF